MLIKKYDFDVTGSSTDNHVPDEIHQRTESNVYLFRAGGAYSDSIIVTQAGKDLIEGVDFKKIVYNQKAHLETGQSVHYGIVLVHNEETEDLSFDYQAVGGEYASYTDVILSLIEKLGLTDSMVRLGDIEGLPEVFPPGPHKTQGDDLVGLSRLVEILARVVDAINTGSPNSMTMVKQLIADKVSKHDNYSLIPLNGSFAVDDSGSSNVTADILIPRSAGQNEMVCVTLEIIGKHGAANCTLYYKEGINSVNTISMVSSPVGDIGTIPYAVAVTNGNMTALRLYSDSAKPILKRVVVKSIHSTDPDAYAKYQEVAIPETPLALSFSRANSTGI